MISDVHGEVDALRRALDDARVQGAGRVVHLGDLGGTDGLDLLETAGAVHVFGNWEASGWGALPEPHRSQVAGWPQRWCASDFCVAHASPVWPDGMGLPDVLPDREATGLPWRNLFPFLDSQPEARRAASATLISIGKNLLFHGHTHKQEAWRLESDGSERVYRPSPSTGRARRTLMAPQDGCLLVGVGSVGAPLHGAGACYALYDDASRVITWRQV
jgi:hypothetical protein